MTIVISGGKDAARRASATAKATTLIEALPWLDQFHGETVVIKYGGHAMTADQLRAGFAQDLVFLRHAGLRPVVVHGGGPQVTEHLERLGIESVFTAGLRVTTAETIDVVRMVLNGKVNKDIVGLINRHGPFAVGLSGEDANLFTAARKLAMVDGEPVDIGLVGEIIDTDPSMVEALLDDGRIPVVSSVARGDGDGAVYNVNADTAAAALAVALGAAKLVVLTDVEGLYRDWPASDEVISQLDADDLEKLLPVPVGRHDPEDGGLPHRGQGRRPPGPRPGRPPQPRHPAGDLHRLRHRHHGPPSAQTPSRSRPRRRAMSESEALRQRFEAAMMVNYGTPPLALARGEGSRVWDADGNRYLDLIAGIAVSALGHAHPAIVDAVTTQVSKIAHTSNLFLHEPEVQLAEKLLDPAARRSPRRRPGLLLQLRHRGERGRAQAGPPPAGQGPPGDRRRRPQLPRPHHGRRSRSPARSRSASRSAPFGFDVRWVEYGDADALRKAVDERTAAVFLEPTQGEGGVIPAPAGYLAAARAACDGAGALLVLDEIQSGIGRTGAWFAHQAEGVTPDVLTLAKGLGGGLPIGACIGFGESATALKTGDHGSTFGGNPIACAAALAVLDTIETDDLLKNVKPVGDALASGIEAIDHPLAQGRPRQRPVAGRRPHREQGGRASPRRPAGGLPRQRRPAGRGAARPAARPHPGRGGRVHRRPARHLDPGQGGEVARWPSGTSSATTT